VLTKVIRASVIVPARNAEGTLPRTLECLCAQTVPFDYEVIVVDDGSRDRTPELVAAASDRVRLVVQEPCGPAAARNRGVEVASGEVLAFCDADCYPTEGWLAAGVRALEAADLVQGKVIAEPGVGIGPYDRTLWIVHEVGLWETANLFVTRELFDRVGGFEDWLRPVPGKALAEDVWFGWRAKRTGARSAFCAEALIHHHVFARRAPEYLAERRRCRHFPEMAAKIPELRDAVLYRRLFLTRRTAAFDAALLGASAALMLRRRWPLTAGLPFARLVAQRAKPYGRSAPKVAAVDVVADLITAWALVAGSVRAGTPVI
jgi:glycosyltransferase involved in cell wall biosynthesis